MRVNRKSNVDEISEDEPHPFDLIKHHPASSMLYATPLKARIQKELVDPPAPKGKAPAAKAQPPATGKKLKLLVQKLDKPARQAATPTTARPAAYKIGDRVEGEFHYENWSDWYPGQVTKILPNGKIRIKFDDGGEIWDRDPKTIRKARK